MATTALLDLAPSGHPTPAFGLKNLSRLVVCAALPLGAFGLVNLGAESLGIFPAFFAPFGLSNWVGAIFHLGQLALLGAACWALTERAGHASVRAWLMGFIALYVALPFVTPLLDALQLSLACTALFLVALASLRRVATISPLAAWLMAPALAIVGLSAALGLTLAAAYAPPFALMQNGSAQASA